MLRFATAGESHGESLVAMVSGLPAGVPVDQALLDRELWRRQRGYGRGGRMHIERDSAHILSGVRHGKTIGSPVAMTIANNDWKNWEEILPVEAGDPAKHKAVASPRPGHADLAGSLKFDFPDARYVLERASARESAARVACGAMAKMLLRALGVEVASHVIRVGQAELSRPAAWEEILALQAKDEVLLNCVDAGDEQRMKAEVDAVLRTGDTVGGVFEVVVHGLPAGRGHARELGRAHGRAAGPGGDEPAGGEGGGDWPRSDGGGVAGIARCTTPLDTKGPATVKTATLPGSLASRTTPAASKAASPTARTWLSGDI